VAEDAKGGDVVMRAMVDEMQRAIDHLQLDDLPKPYFVQLKAQDRVTYSIGASYGGLVRSSNRHNRYVGVRNRVGSYVFDNTNVPQSYGQAGMLPLENDYAALRHAIWLLLDKDYKSAVEMLARKEAYLKTRTVEDRPDDFSGAPPVTVSRPPVRLKLPVKEWEEKLVTLSRRFKDHADIQSSSVSLVGGSVTEWLVNSEGTRFRDSDSGLWLEIKARAQAADGMPLSDSRTYLAEELDQLPSMEKVASDIDAMCANLIALRNSSVPEQYTGPVLFEPQAAGGVFESLLADGLCARPVPLGAGRWGDQSLEKKIGLRILPRSFQVYDDPGP
jgi:hypothetical protein